MAVVTIMIIDTGDGNVGLRTVSDPPLPEEAEEATLAQKMAVDMVGRLMDKVEGAGIGVVRQPVSGGN
jgi:hypothetical protein